MGFSPHLGLLTCVARKTTGHGKSQRRDPAGSSGELGSGEGVFALLRLLLALRLMPPHYRVFQWQTIKLKVSITSALSLRFASLLSIHHMPALLQPIAADLHQLLIY